MATRPRTPAELDQVISPIMATVTAEWCTAQKFLKASDSLLAIYDWDAAHRMREAAMMHIEAALDATERAHRTLEILAAGQGQ
jgi:hypothetical protein